MSDEYFYGGFVRYDDFANHTRRGEQWAYVSACDVVLAVALPEDDFSRHLSELGVTLSATHQVETWDPEAKAEYPRSNKLLIRQALLGPDAKPDELNVVQVETMSLQEAIKIPVAVLKAGETRHARLDIEFPDAPVTFTLIQGTGPVHLIGQHLLGSLVEEFEDMEEMEEEMLDEEEGDDSQFKEDENKKKAAGKRKVNEDEDDEEGEPKGKKAKMSNNAKGKAPSPKKNAKK